MEDLLETLRRLLSEGTPGEWEAERFGCITANVDGKRRQVAAVQGDAATYGDAERPADDIRDANARLIVELHNAAGKLLDVIEAAKAYRIAANFNRIAQLSETWTVHCEAAVDASRAFDALGRSLDSLSHLNANGLVDGYIPAGKSCPFYECGVHSDECPNPTNLHSRPFYCSRAVSISRVMSEAKIAPTKKERK